MNYTFSTNNDTFDTLHNIALESVLGDVKEKNKHYEFRIDLRTIIPEFCIGYKVHKIQLRTIKKTKKYTQVLIFKLVYVNKKIEDDTLKDYIKLYAKSFSCEKWFGFSDDNIKEHFSKQELFSDMANKNIPTNIYKLALDKINQYCIDNGMIET